MKGNRSSECAFITGKYRYPYCKEVAKYRTKEDRLVILYVELSLASMYTSESSFHFNTKRQVQAIIHDTNNNFINHFLILICAKQKKDSIEGGVAPNLLMHISFQKCIYKMAKRQNLLHLNGTSF